MHVILWILMGVVASFVITVLAPDMRARPASRVARASVNSGAGVVGALGGASSHVWFDRASAGGLTTALASLAGALWLAGIVEVYSSRRQRSDATVPDDSTPTPAAEDPDVTGYEAARQAVVAGLLEDAQAHEAGRYAEIGRQLPLVRDRVSRQDPAWNFRLQLALRFWRGWTLARDERWRSSDAELAMVAADWPRFARTIATDLSLDRDTMDPAIIGRFAYATPWRVAGATSLAPRR